jgi:hypothetical protein
VRHGKSVQVKKWISISLAFASGVAVRRFPHCDFTQNERDRAFNDLVKWVRTGRKPQGDNLSGALTDVGRAWTDPLRPDDPGSNKLYSLMGELYVD